MGVWKVGSRALRRWALTLLAACGLFTGGVAAASDELVFAVSRRQALSLPVVIAEAEGYFKSEGLALRIVDCSIGRLCLKQLLDGQAHLATVADSPIVFASLSNDRFVVLATMTTNRNDSKIVSRKSSGIRTPADLAGRRVGVFVGTSAHYFLDLVTLLNGVDPARVSLVNLAPEAAAAALVAGQVDALVVFEPYAHAAVRALRDDAQVLSNKRVYEQTWNIVAAKGITGARDRELQAMLRALGRADRFIHEQPTRAKAIMRERTGLDEAGVEWLWADLAFKLTLEQSLLNTLEGQARWALRNGHASGRAPNYLDRLYPGPLERVRPGAVTVVR